MNHKTIELQSLSIGYSRNNDKNVVAQGLTTSLNSGELTCLLGANGVGKSTLLRTLAAFQPRLGGDIIIEGRHIDNYSDKTLSRLLGVVLTEKCDIRNMTVYELVSLGRSPYTGFWGSLDKKDKLIVDNAIGMVGIKNLSHRMVHTLSDGERQKVMIAKALAQETPIIFLDEPTAFLDFPSKVEIMKLLHTLTREAGKTVFLSTHDLELALQIADKVWLMSKKRGIEIGTPEDLALGGSLANFISKEGIVFDAEAGLFRIKNSYVRQIAVCGDGQRFHMMRKALHRNCIGTIEDATAVESIYPRINITKDSFEVRITNGESDTVKTIEEVLQAIKEMT